MGFDGKGNSVFKVPEFMKEDKTFDIICCHMNIFFKMERVKGDAIVFVDSHLNDRHKYYTIKCSSSQEREKKLKELRSTDLGD